MKKFIFIIVAVLGLGFSAQAQNANRSGAFIEFSGGHIVIKGDLFSGVTFQLSGGYRWAFARHWALDGKVGCLLPMDEKDNFTIKIGPALRYTSNEIGNSNTSIYVALNPNLTIMPIIPVTKYEDNLDRGHQDFGYEIHVGVNTTTKFSIGVIWNGLFFDKGHTGGIGINFGYRF